MDEALPAPISAAGDGPYLLPASAGWLARSVSSDLAPLSRSVSALGHVSVDRVGDVPAFTVPLRGRVSTPAPDTLPLAPSARLLVMADTHGEYGITVAFLKAQGVVDDELKWTFGSGQMAVTGDVFDRGPHQLEILWLLYKLEAEANAAGGALHVLLGNHESMILRGDLRYLHPRYPETARILGVESYAELFTPETLLGDWLRSRPSVMKLGDLLLLHGGISPEVLDDGLTVTALNQGIRKALETPVARRSELDAQTALIAGSRGPQWYRGYFPGSDGQPAAMDAAGVERTLAQYGVSRILVGHTPVDQVQALYGGAVVAVQVYPHLDKTTGAPVLEGALREDSAWFRVGIGGVRERL